MQWHQKTKYYTELGTAIPTNTGVRQGCVIAPILWRVYSHCWALDLSVHRPSLPITHILSMFADDYLFCWNILDALDFTSALSDVRYIIHHLRTWTLEPSLGKTRLLVRVCGAQSPVLLQQHLPRDQHKKRALHMAKGETIQVAHTHTYLGIVISYGNMQAQTFQHRLKQARATHVRLTLWWKAKRLPCASRLKLWRSTVLPTLNHGLNVLGLDSHGKRLYTGFVMRCIRQVHHNYAHISRESNEQFRAEHQMQHP